MPLPKIPSYRIFFYILQFFYIQKYNPTFKAEFEIAPYFEMASDLGGELKKINEAINQHDINYIQNKLGKQMFKKLKVFQGSDHPHESQQPTIWEPKI